MFPDSVKILFMIPVGVTCYLRKKNMSAFQF